MGNGATTVGKTLFRQVVLHRLFERIDVDSLVFVKAGILTDDDGPDHAVRNRLDRHRIPAEFWPIRMVVPLELVTADEAGTLNRAVRVHLPFRPNPDQVTEIHHDQDR